MNNTLFSNHFPLVLSKHTVEKAKPHVSKIPEEKLHLCVLHFVFCAQAGAPLLLPSLLGPTGQLGPAGHQRLSRDSVTVLLLWHLQGVSSCMAMSHCVRSLPKAHGDFSLFPPLLFGPPAASTEPWFYPATSGLAAFTLAEPLSGRVILSFKRQHIWLTRP